MKQIIPLVFIHLSIVCGCMQLQAQHAAPYTPQLYPDRIFLNVTEDASQSIAVSWRTSTLVTESRLEIVEAADNPDAIKKAISHPAITESISFNNIQANFHAVKVSALQPNTLYMYRVGQGNYWSEWFHVKTADKFPKKFSFIYLGDVQEGMRSLWPRVIRQAYTQVPDARLIVYAGDLVNKGASDREWGELCYGGSFIHGSIPGLPSPGNHEHYSENDVQELTPFWQAHFALPDNGPDSLKETVFYSDVQGVRFISLNTQMMKHSEEKLRQQIVWLHKVLKNNPNKWTCIIFHHPVYAVNAKRDNKILRNNFQPIFDQYKVDLVLQGHDHVYGRGMKKIKQYGSEIPSGTMYVVSMSGSKMYPEVEKEWMDKGVGNLQLYQIITVDGDLLTYKSYTATGTVFDQFQLMKQKGKPNKLIEIKK